MDAYVAVLLSQPLRLNHLSMGYSFLKQCKMVALVLRSTLYEEALDCGLQPDFGHLKTVTFERYTSYIEPETRKNVADFLPLFYLPSVERISVAVHNTTTPSWPPTLPWPTIYPPSCSNLRSLKRDAVREPLLGPLLLATDQLRSLMGMAS